MSCRLLPILGSEDITRVGAAVLEVGGQKSESEDGRKFPNSHFWLVEVHELNE